jgi:hypothetical protein
MTKEEFLAKSERERDAVVAEAMGQGTYTVPAFCENCQWAGLVTITKGFGVNATPCPVCKCKTLRAQLKVTL